MSVLCWLDGGLRGGDWGSTIVPPLTSYPKTNYITSCRHFDMMSFQVAVVPTTSAMLFGIAGWVRWIVRFDARPAIVVLGIMTVSTGAFLSSSVTDRRVDARHHFALEPATLWLMEWPPRRLVFLWTDHTAAVAPARNLTDLAGFVFRHEGHPAAVQFVRPVAGRGTSRRARDAAGGDPTAILWLANDRDGSADAVAYRRPGSGLRMPRVRRRVISLQTLAVASLQPRWICSPRR